MFQMLSFNCHGWLYHFTLNTFCQKHVDNKYGNELYPVKYSIICEKVLSSKENLVKDPKVWP